MSPPWTEPAMHRVTSALLQEQRSSKAHPEGGVHAKETSHCLIEVLKKFLSDFSTQKQSLMTVEDLTSAIARLEQSQAQAMAAVAAPSEQIASLRVAIKDDKADKPVYLQSTSELEID